ncbi:hypothetical protein [Acidithiobacillus sulfuriphilus]|uniref:Uncharacterized protein n=2 Tax=Acidithiobacillus sulfuriphilus TaxID=1867749 RepID=A0ACD5HNY7_9PROT|nr:hypothetical protein [Acidithiobacillus sulfuriphilus]
MMQRIVPLMLRCLLVLLVFLQAAAPFVHAHMGFTPAGSGLHLHFYENAPDELPMAYGNAVGAADPATILPAATDLQAWAGNHDSHGVDTLAIGSFVKEHAAPLALLTGVFLSLLILNLPAKGRTAPILAFSVSLPDFWRNGPILTRAPPALP